MDVSKAVLRKLSDEQLYQYLKDGNRFVHDACQLAFEILIEERGTAFSDEERSRINNMLKRKRESEAVAGHKMDKDVVPDIPENNTYPELYSEKNVFMISLFNPFVGCWLFYENLQGLGKLTFRNLLVVVSFFTGGAIIWLVYRIMWAKKLYSFISLYGSSISPLKSEMRFHRQNVIVGSVIVGIILTYLWSILLKDVKYRSRDITKPFILAVVISVSYVLLKYFN